VFSWTWAVLIGSVSFESVSKRKIEAAGASNYEVCRAFGTEGCSFSGRMSRVSENQLGVLTSRRNDEAQSLLYQADWRIVLGFEDDRFQNI
jgi:hypothetical protein